METIIVVRHATGLLFGRVDAGQPLTGQVELKKAAQLVTMEHPETHQPIKMFLPLSDWQEDFLSVNVNLDHQVWWKADAGIAKAYEQNTSSIQLLS